MGSGIEAFPDLGRHCHKLVVCETCSVAIETTGCDGEDEKKLLERHGKFGDCDPRKKMKSACPVRHCKEVEEAIESERAIERAFKEDEERWNTPLTAENSGRVMDAMRRISVGGSAPDWAGQIPEDQ